MKKNKSGAELTLLKIVESRCWHGIKNNEVAQQRANRDKMLLKSGKLGHGKIVDWLNKLGYKMTTVDVWQKK